ncbi:hypothetical protein F2Q68_00012898 [Brassica cretica]|uniref:Uncharacterized protein n=1 Tax=Brassica cretica TaxID=69181 RepID=A0A8S9HHK4_BRACR|nr:hypothetical protein F2Q68_00012898 [Brassica cretica]
MNAAHPYPKVVDRVSVPLSSYEVSGICFVGRYPLAGVGSSDSRVMWVLEVEVIVWRVMGSNDISPIIGLYSVRKSAELLFKTLL